MQLLIFRTPAVVLVLMMRLTKSDDEAHLPLAVTVLS